MGRNWSFGLDPLSVAANPGEVVEFPGFEKIAYMQDLTNAQCYHAEIGETKQLVDKRDNKSYWVTKLKDGNCWMTQNLDYDIPENELPGVVKVTDTGGRYGGPSSAEDGGKWVESISVPYYWDPGEKYVIAPEEGGHGTLVDAIITTENDRHYLVGNYYNWVAATAKTGVGFDTNGLNATGNICPAEWRLPTSDPDTNDTQIKTNGSFNYLIKSIGTSNDLAKKLQEAPFYFVANGNVSANILDSGGTYGQYWSSSNYSTNRSYMLNFHSDIVDLTVTGAKIFGRPVRCLVLGS